MHKGTFGKWSLLATITGKSHPDFTHLSHHSLGCWAAAYWLCPLRAKTCIQNCKQLSKVAKNNYISVHASKQKGRKKNVFGKTRNIQQTVEWNWAKSYIKIAFGSHLYLGIRTIMIQYKCTLCRICHLILALRYLIAVDNAVTERSNRRDTEKN